MMPGFCNTHAKQRAASTTPGCTMAPVGQASRQRRQLPQPSGAGSALVGNGAVVTTHPSTNQLPAPGTSRFAFLPYHPMPAWYATSRSTMLLSSAKGTALNPSARRRCATAHSAARNGA